MVARMSNIPKIDPFRLLPFLKEPGIDIVLLSAFFMARRMTRHCRCPPGDQFKSRIISELASS